MQEDIRILENKLKEIEAEQSSLEGQCSLISEQLNKSEHLVHKLETDKELYAKAVELLTLVQQETKGKIKEGFESIVSYALTYVLSNTDYGLNLEFNKRGNLQELDLNLKTPNCQDPHDPLLSSGGGALDILSLALRIALLEVSRPKIEGFVVLDEPFKHLSPEFIEKSVEFVKIISKKINRQTIVVTHIKEFINIADKSIEIK